MEIITKINRERGWLYFIDKEGDIARCPMAKGKQTVRHLSEKVMKIGIKRKKGFLYYLDSEGNVCKKQKGKDEEVEEDRNIIENKGKIKDSYCERCGREINHPGRCLPCNYLYKNKAYFPGLRENSEYDLKHNFDIKLVKSLLNEKEFKPISELLDKGVEGESLVDIGNYERDNCGVCGNEFNSKNGKYKICYDCYKFYKKYGGIRSYQTFLIAFGLEDNQESKENYIKFVDDFNKFIDFYFEDEE